MFKNDTENDMFKNDTIIEDFYEKTLKFFEKSIESSKKTF